MSIIKHFSEGNNDQEYEGMHSHWKEEQSKGLVGGGDTQEKESSTEKILTDVWNSGYNQGMEVAIGVANHFKGVDQTADAAIDKIVENITRLKKKQP